MEKRRSEEIDEIVIPDRAGMHGPAASAWKQAYLGAIIRGLSDADAKIEADRRLEVGQRLIRAESGKIAAPPVEMGG